MVNRLAESFMNYQIFYEKLKEEGGDIEGLDVDFMKPPQDKIYSPPLEDSDTEKRAST